MSIRKKLELEWDGGKYSLLVTMEVIDRVEDSINVGRLLAQQTNGDVRFSHIAKFISIILNEAGASTTQESVYEEIFAGDKVTLSDAITMSNHILSSFFPETKKKVKGGK